MQEKRNEKRREGRFINHSLAALFGGTQMDMDTIISKWFSTREQQITWSVCLVFLIIFPLYFANMASFLPGGATVVSGDSSGSWSVTFTENEEDGEETIEDMEHEDTYELEFSFDDMAPNLAYIEIIVEHTESGEQGPAPGPFGNIEPWQEQCDTVDVELDMDDVNGWIEDGSTTSSSSSDCPSTQVLRIFMMKNYTGQDYQTDGSKNSILAMYDDADQGRGDWKAEITLTVNEGSGPGPGATSNRDNGETVTISWRAVSVEVEVTAYVDTSIEL